MPNPPPQVRSRHLRSVLRWIFLAALLAAIGGGVSNLAYQVTRQMMGNGAAINWRGVLAFMAVSFVWGAIIGIRFGLRSPQRSRQQVVAAELAAEAAETAAATAKILAAEAGNRAAEAKSAAAAAGRAIAEGAPPDVVESAAAEAASAAQAAEAAASVADGAATVADSASNVAARWQTPLLDRMLVLCRRPTSIAGLVMISFSVLAFAGLVFALSHGLRGVAWSLEILFLIGGLGALLVLNTLIISVARLAALNDRSNRNPMPLLPKTRGDEHFENP